jgi:hypothetical protein
MSAIMADALLLKIIRKAEDVNALAIALLATTPGVFDQVSHKIPKLEPAELGCIRTSSWLYVLYYEAGRVNRQYVEGLLAAYGLQSGVGADHSRLVHAVRTFLQHNLDITEPHDKSLISRCHEWFKAKCGTAVPANDEEWQQCLLAILTEAIEYLDTLEKCLRSVEKDTSRQAICDEWLFKRKRYHSPEQFDELIPIVATDIGREHLDMIAFRNRYYDRWIGQLRALSSDYDFRIEARKLIEDSLLKDVTSVLPITGADILEQFGLAPGRQIGVVLAEAKKSYEANPCSPDALIDRLRPFVEELQSQAGPEK